MTVTSRGKEPFGRGLSVWTSAMRLNWTAASAASRSFREQRGVAPRSPKTSFNNRRRHLVLSDVREIRDRSDKAVQPHDLLDAFQVLHGRFELGQGVDDANPSCLISLSMLTSAPSLPMTASFRHSR